VRFIHPKAVERAEDDHLLINWDKTA